MIPIGGFQPLTLSDFPGTPAALVFVRGCTMRCPYCHNRGLWQRGAACDPEDVLARIAARRHLLRGAVVSGGEPTMHPGLDGFMRRLRAIGLRVKLDTNGSRPQALRELLAQGLADHVALDLKADAAGHDRATGSRDLHRAVQESLAVLRASGAAYEVRTTVCGGLHDGAGLERIAAGLRPGERWFLQGFRPARDADPGLRPPDPDLLAHARDRARAAGIAAAIR